MENGAFSIASVANELGKTSRRLRLKSAMEGDSEFEVLLDALNVFGGKDVEFRAF